MGTLKRVFWDVCVYTHMYIYICAIRPRTQEWGYSLGHDLSDATTEAILSELLIGVCSVETHWVLTRAPN